MKNYMVLSLLLFGFSCSTGEGETQELPPISEVFDGFYTDGLDLYPTSATSLGLEGYNDKFGNSLDSEYQKKELDYYKKYLDAISAYDIASLQEPDRTNAEVLKWYAETMIEVLDNPIWENMPVNQFWSTNLSIMQLATGKGSQPFKTAEDYDNWLKRLDGYLGWMDDALASMKQGVELNYVHPKTIVRKIIPQFEAMVSDDVESHLFYMPIHSMPDSLAAEDKERLKTAYAKVVKDEVVPRYAQMSEYLKGEYLAASRETSGIGQLPNGSETYQTMIKLFTSTELSADSVHKLGLSEVARIRGEMEKVKQEVGFDGTLLEFFDHVRNKKELMPFTDPQQVIDNFYAIHERMKPNLNKLFDLKPKTPFEVRRTEAFREASASAQYNQGSPDGSRPGIFYVPIPDVTSYNTYADEDLFLHEAIPGHHYQIMLALESDDIPDFRNLVFFGAYTEGWALYTEALGKELGLYEDPYQYFGMLSAEMHRAIRLVVDTGLHSKGWTREEAIQYSLENEAEPEASIISEIERYMVLPGQALSYKLGQLTILSLRDRAEKELGDKFDIKAFHREILVGGELPLAVLEKRMLDWIERQK